MSETSARVALLDGQLTVTSGVNIDLHDRDLETEWLADIPFRIPGEADDVREMRADPVFAAESYDVAVDLGTVLSLPGREEGPAVEGLDADEHREAPGPGQECH